MGLESGVKTSESDRSDLLVSFGLALFFGLVQLAIHEILFRERCFKPTPRNACLRNFCCCLPCSSGNPPAGTAGVHPSPPCPCRAVSEAASRRAASSACPIGIADSPTGSSGWPTGCAAPPTASSAWPTAPFAAPLRCSGRPDQVPESTLRRPAPSCALGPPSARCDHLPTSLSPACPGIGPCCCRHGGTWSWPWAALWAQAWAAGPVVLPQVADALLFQAVVLVVLAQVAASHRVLLWCSSSATCCDYQLRCCFATTCCHHCHPSPILTAASVPWR